MLLALLLSGEWLRIDWTLNVENTLLIGGALGMAWRHSASWFRSVAALKQQMGLLQEQITKFCADVDTNNRREHALRQRVASIEEELTRIGDNLHGLKAFCQGLPEVPGMAMKWIERAWKPAPPEGE